MEQTEISTFLADPNLAIFPVAKLNDLKYTFIMMCMILIILIWARNVSGIIIWDAVYFISPEHLMISFIRRIIKYYITLGISVPVNVIVAMPHGGYRELVTEWVLCLTLALVTPDKYVLRTNSHRKHTKNTGLTQMQTLLWKLAGPCPRYCIMRAPSSS